MRSWSAAKKAGFKAVPTGIDHGTVTVIVDGEPFEVTTLREDVETDGRHAVVHFGRDFVLDARRRDFTINALSLGFDGQLYDYTDGVSDLAARRVRFIGDAHTRIREDYLRIMRFFRFHAEYAEGDPDPEGPRRVGSREDGIARSCSKERIRHELLEASSSRGGLRTPSAILADHGFLTGLLGGAWRSSDASIVWLPSTGKGRFRSGVWRRSPSWSRRMRRRLRERLRLSNDEDKKLCRLRTAPHPAQDLGLAARCGCHPPARRPTTISRSWTSPWPPSAHEPLPVVHGRCPSRLSPAFAAASSRCPVFPCAAPISSRAVSRRAEDRRIARPGPPGLAGGRLPDRPRITRRTRPGGCWSRFSAHCPPLEGNTRDGAIGGDPSSPPRRGPALCRPSRSCETQRFFELGSPARGR